MTEQQAITTNDIIVKLRMMARYPTVTLPRDTEALKRAADLLEAKDEPVIDESAAKRIATALGWEPKREWVGLRDEEIETIYAACSAWDRFEYERMLEAKLKEKNGGAA